jgi:glycosyltransferase involved in cell wall biosynthesis
MQPTPLALFVGSWLPLSETFIYDQLQQQRRFEAHVFARGLSATCRHFPYDHVVALRPLERLGYCQFGVAPSVARELDCRRIELIHAHFGLNGVMALPFARRLSVPLVVTFHGHDVGGLLPQNRWRMRYFRYQRQARALFDTARLLVCSSAELAERLLEFGAPEKKIHVHQLGVDVSEFRPEPTPAPEPRIVLVGRLVPKKGFGDAVRAFARVAPRFSEAKLDIIGDGPLRQKLRDAVAELGLCERVAFLGARTRSDVRACLARAAFLAAPSYTPPDGDRESGLLVLKEAAASGLPTIGTRHGGIPEIIDHGVTGLLVAERSVAELSEAFACLLSDAALRRRLGRAARRKAEREYDTVRQNARLETLLASVL